MALGTVLTLKTRNVPKRERSARAPLAAGVMTSCTPGERQEGENGKQACAPLWKTVVTSWEPQAPRPHFDNCCPRRGFRARRLALGTAGWTIYRTLVVQRNDQNSLATLGRHSGFPATLATARAAAPPALVPARALSCPGQPPEPTATPQPALLHSAPGNARPRDPASPPPHSRRQASMATRRPHPSTALG